MQRIGFVVFDGFQSMSFAALSVFEYANVMMGKPIYEMQFISEEGGPVRSSTGMVVDSKRFNRTAYDTVIVGGGESILEHAPAGLLAFISQGVEDFASHRVDLHRQFYSSRSRHS
jgi:transcriptional regulator GlxA family with amidase domain